jgi:hypothetical protein
MLVQGGVMATHDEETRKFFKHSSVICVLSPRYASNKLSIFKQQASFGQEFVVCVFVLYTRKNSGGKGGGGLALPPRKIPYKSNSKKKMQNTFLIF